MIARLVEISLVQRVLLCALGLALLFGGLYAFHLLDIIAYPDPSPPMVELMEILVKTTELLRAELPALRRHEYSKLIAVGRTIKHHEKEGDRVFRNAVGALFHDPDIDANGLRISWAIPAAISPTAASRCCIRASRSSFLTAVRS